MKKFVLVAVLVLAYFSAYGQDNRPNTNNNNAPQQIKTDPTVVKKQYNVFSPITQLPYYTEPGIIGFKDDKWIGSDHLYNLTDELGVIVEIVRMPGATRSLDEKIIEQNVLEMFKKANMRGFPLTGGAMPPLPFYHVLIITMPMPNSGKVGYVSCRLFENVSLSRVQTADGIFWQAITWEDQTLVQTSDEDFPNHIYEDVNQITKKFIDRYKHFQELRKRFIR